MWTIFKNCLENVNKSGIFKNSNMLQPGFYTKNKNKIKNVWRKTVPLVFRLDNSSCFIWGNRIVYFVVTSRINIINTDLSTIIILLSILYFLGNFSIRPLPRRHQNVKPLSVFDAGTRLTILWRLNNRPSVYSIIKLCTRCYFVVKGKKIKPSIFSTKKNPCNFTRDPVCITLRAPGFYVYLFIIIIIVFFFPPLSFSFLQRIYLRNRLFVAKRGKIKHLGFCWCGRRCRISKRNIGKQTNPEVLIEIYDTVVCVDLYIWKH